MSGRNAKLEDRIYLQWAVNLDRISDKSLLNFRAYFDRVTGKDLDQRPVDEILQDIDDAMRRLNNGNEHI